MSKTAHWHLGVTRVFLISSFCLFSAPLLVSCSVEKSTSSQPYADTLENRKKSGKLYLQYRDLMQDKKYDEAQKLVDELDKYEAGLGPQLRGEIAYAQGKFAEADKYILEAIKADPENCPFWEYAAIYAYRQGHVEAAIERATQSINKKGAEGKPSTAYVIRALGYHRHGHLQKAIADLNEALKLEPSNVEALYLKGVCLDEARKPKEALDAFAEALRWEPTLHSAMKRRLAIYMRLGDKANAKRELEAFDKQAKARAMTSAKDWIPSDLSTDQVKRIVQNPKAE